MYSDAERLTGTAVLDNLSDPLFVVDTAGTIAHANEQMYAVTGWDSDTNRTHSLAQLEPFVGEGFDSLRRRVQAVLDDETTEAQIRVSLTPRVSSPIPLEYTAEARLTRLTDEEGLLGVLVVFRESTPWSDRSRSVHEEQRFRAMFESHSAPMLLIDPESGEIAEANGAAAEFYGYEIDELTAMTIQEINRLTPEEVARERRQAERENRNHFIFEHELASGAVRTVEVHSSPVAVSGETHLFSIIHDITERMESKHERQLFKAAVSRTGHAVFITDENGIIEYVNPAFEADTGYDRSEAVGQTPAIFKSAEQAEDFYENLWETIPPDDVWNAELVNRRKSGELYYVEQTIAPITDDDGEITNFVGVQLDITDRKLREKQLSDLNRILRHNLRNALTAVKGHTQALLDEAREDQQSQLEQILGQAEALAETSEKVTTIRRLLKQEHDSGETCNIQTVLSQVVSDLESAYPGAVIRTDPAQVSITLAPDLCQMLLAELIENAIVHNDSETPQVTVSVSHSADPSQHVTVQVADDGPGIPEQERTAVNVGADDPLTHSSGVGLAYVHWHVINCGGTMTITENEPRGSIVTLSLPRADS